MAGTAGADAGNPKKAPGQNKDKATGKITAYIPDFLTNVVLTTICRIFFVRSETINVMISRLSFHFSRLTYHKMPV
jgi:hypothetical protein